MIICQAVYLGDVDLGYRRPKYPVQVDSAQLMKCDWAWPAAIWMNPLCSPCPSATWINPPSDGWSTLEGLLTAAA